MCTYTLIHRHRIIHWLSVCYVQNKMNFYLYCSVKTITLRKDVLCFEFNIYPCWGTEVFLLTRSTKRTRIVNLAGVSPE